MKFVTWIEAILVVTLVALAVAAMLVARQISTNLRGDEKPVEASFLRKAEVEVAEQELALARETLTRVHAAVVDSYAEIVRRDAAVAAGVAKVEEADAARRAARGLETYLARIRKSVGALEKVVAARKKVASARFRAAEREYARSTRLLSVGSAAAAVLLLFGLAFAIVSLPRVRNALQIHRGVVFLTAASLLAFVVMYEVFREPGVVLAAAAAVLALVVLVARATPQQETRP